MAEFDLVIRNAAIHDGAGSPERHGDIAVADGRFAAVGAVEGRGRREIDAEGRVAAPGFVDVHTHYDGQVTWENRLAPSSAHGVTTVVMGNCGVGFAPCRPDQHGLLVSLMEGVEDIPEVVMAEGLPWTWETFPEYLDAVAARAFDIDVAAQLPHSALRVFVMGERGARQEVPTQRDLERMQTLTAEAIRHGALGVTTSRALLHRTRAGDLAPSVFSEAQELCALARGLADAGRGVFQLIPRLPSDVQEEMSLIRLLARTAGRPVSFSLLQLPGDERGAWREALAEIDASPDGLDIRAQVYPRPVGMLYGLDLSFHPFSLKPSFRSLENLPLPQKLAALRDPAVRARLLGEPSQDSNPVTLKLVANSRFAYELGDPPRYEPALSERIDVRAAALGLSAEEYAYDLLLKDEGRAILYLPGANFRENSLSAVFEMLTHPRTIWALGDGGAHYGMICDASYPTFALLRWVRDAGAQTISLSSAIAALSGRPAHAVGLRDRGRIAPGLKADLNLIDMDALALGAPKAVRDLPAGGRRLHQNAQGYAATVVSGEVTYENGVATGALPGRLVRGT